MDLRRRFTVERNIEFVALAPIAHVHRMLGQAAQAFGGELHVAPLFQFGKAGFESIDGAAGQHHGTGIIAHCIGEQDAHC